MIFLDRPKHEPKTAKERDEHIENSKLLSKSNSPFCVLVAYPDVIVIEQDGTEIPVSVDRCSKGNPENAVPDNSNLKTDRNSPDFRLPHPLVTENTEVFVNEPTYHPSEKPPSKASIKSLRTNSTGQSKSQILPFLTPTNQMHGLPLLHLITRTDLTHP